MTMLPQLAAEALAGAEQTPHFESVTAMLRALEPDDPVECIRPARIAENVRRFAAGFPGCVAFAVKANPHGAVLCAMRDAGLGHYDVASLAEIEAIQRIAPQAELFFHNPVKSRRSIRESYRARGVRRFVVDHTSELEKVLDETGDRDLVVLVRLAFSGAAVAQDFSSKFGAAPDEAVALLRAASSAGVRTGLAFHLGTHCTDPAAFARALRLCGDVLARSGVAAACVSVGGGFPGAYTGQAIPPMDGYFAAIGHVWRELSLDGCMLMCEPGRAFVADAVSVVMRVAFRRGSVLYVTDGPAGSLGDLWFQERGAPVRVHRRSGEVTGVRADFRIAGPLSYDCNDDLPGVFSLPENIRAGDWIEIGELGAYGASMAADLQDFHRVPAVTLDA